MTGDQIRAELAECHELPEGRAKAQRLESLAEQARQAGERRLEAEVLMALATAYLYSAEKSRMPVAFGRLLQLLDGYGAEIGDLAWEIHWMMKWLTTALIRNPAVPLETDYRWLDELEGRYAQCGYSTRPVHSLRSALAQNLGDADTASAQMEASIAAPRDGMSDCQACEHNGLGSWRAAAGDDAGALTYWAPVLDTTLTCAEEPHRVLAKALLPLLRTGQADAARGAFLRGYPLARQHVSLMPAIGAHIEFCALTGNEPRGLEILAEHAAWLADTQVDTHDRLAFIGGVTVLLRRLRGLGHGDLPAGSATVAALAGQLDGEIRELCARYDARNGNSAVSDRVAARLAAGPLTDQLPLGIPAHLPAAQPQPQPRPVTERPVTAHAAAPAEAIDGLIEEALRLTEIRHPAMSKAWTQVTAAARDRQAGLPADMAAMAARAAAGDAIRTDPRAASQALFDVAGQFAAIGDVSRELEARGTAALALDLAGDHGDADATIAEVTKLAEAAFDYGTLVPRHYMNVRMTNLMIAMQRLAAAGQRAEQDIEAIAAAAAAAKDAASRLAQPTHVAMCYHMLAQISLWRGDRDGARARLMAARDGFLAAGQPWFAVQPEETLGGFALQDRDPEAAESYARAALAHGAELEPRQLAQLSSLLAAALGEQPEKAAEYAGASLAAAARWDGISEPDTLHNTFNAARAYAGLNRHGEAVALFAEAMPRVDLPYQPRAVAMTREQYGHSLRVLGRHDEAADQFLRAAQVIAGDPEHATEHAGLAARAAEELANAGHHEQALPAYQRAAQLFSELGDTALAAKLADAASQLEAWLRDAGD